MEENELREMIDVFYKAGGQPGWSGEINESVAAIFGVMLHETAKCSKAMNWVPRPPSGRATIKWLVQSIGRSVILGMQNKSYYICIQRVIANWGGELQRASATDMIGDLPQWS